MFDIIITKIQFRKTINENDKFRYIITKRKKKKAYKC